MSMYEIAIAYWGGLVAFGIGFGALAGLADAAYRAAAKGAPVPQLASRTFATVEPISRRFAEI